MDLKMVTNFQLFPFSDLILHVFPFHCFGTKGLRGETSSVAISTPPWQHEAAHYGKLMLSAQNLASLCNAAATALNLACFMLCWVQDKGIPAGQANLGYSNMAADCLLWSESTKTMYCFYFRVFEIRKGLCNTAHMPGPVTSWFRSVQPHLEGAVKCKSGWQHLL